MLQPAKDFFVCTAGHQAPCVCLGELPSSLYLPFAPPPTPPQAPPNWQEALVQKDTMRWQLRLAGRPQPEQEERLPPAGSLLVFASVCVTTFYN